VTKGLRTLFTLPKVLSGLWVLFLVTVFVYFFIFIDHAPLVELFNGEARRNGLVFISLWLIPTSIFMGILLGMVGVFLIIDLFKFRVVKRRTNLGS